MVNQYCQTRMEHLPHYRIADQKALFTMDQLREGNIAKEYCNKMRLPDLTVSLKQLARHALTSIVQTPALTCSCS